MGNKESEFQNQFYKLYRFIGIIEDPYFKTVKIYRKIKFNHNYIMIVEKPMVQFSMPSQFTSTKAFLMDKLGLIRRFQNGFTAQLQYFRLLEQKTLECGVPIIRMYMEYYNHTLYDYLNALRLKRGSLTIDELILIIKSLAESLLTLRKMKIENFEINMNNIFVSADNGKIVLNPTYFLYHAVNLTSSKNTLNTLTKEFQSFSFNYERNNQYLVRSISQKMNFSLQKKQLQNIKLILLQLTRYLHNNYLKQSQQLYKILHNFTYVSQILDIFASDIDQLNVEQFGETSNENVELYQGINQNE